MHVVVALMSRRRRGIGGGEGLCERSVVEVLSEEGEVDQTEVGSEPSLTHLIISFCLECPEPDVPGKAAGR